jgi:hypothetical protein
MAEVRELLVIQQSKDLTQSSLKELDRLIDFYNNLENNQADDGQISAEVTPGTDAAPEAGGTTEMEGTAPTESARAAADAPPASEGGVP